MSRAARRILASVVAIVVIVLVAGVWIIRGPGPLDFAGGAKVAASGGTAEGSLSNSQRTRL